MWDWIEVAPLSWIALPLEVHQAPSLTTFHWHMNMELFGQAFFLKKVATFLGGMCVLNVLICIRQHSGSEKWDTELHYK